MSDKTRCRSQVGREAYDLDFPLTSNTRTEKFTNFIGLPLLMPSEKILKNIALK